MMIGGRKSGQPAKEIRTGKGLPEREALFLCIEVTASHLHPHFIGQPIALRYSSKRAPILPAKAAQATVLRGGGKQNGNSQKTTIS